MAGTMAYCFRQLFCKVAHIDYLKGLNKAGFRFAHTGSPFGKKVVFYKV